MRRGIWEGLERGKLMEKCNYIICSIKLKLIAWMKQRVLVSDFIKGICDNIIKYIFGY